MSTWSFRGTALEDIGFVTEVWDSAKLPAFRGENILIPFRNGRVHIAKYFEQRTISLGIEIVKESIEEIENAVDELKALMGLRTLGVLQQTMESGAVRVGMAECAGDLNPQRVSPVSSKFVLDFVMPDPFFYGTTLEGDFASIATSPTAMTINNPGTTEHRNPKITLTGPLQNTVIANATSGVTLTYNGTIAAGETVVIETNDTGEYIAYYGIANVIGLVAHSGSSAMMIISPGDNSISVTDALADGGEVKIEFYAPYL